MDNKTKQRTVGGVVIVAALILIVPLFWHAMKKQPTVAPIEMEFPPPPEKPYVDNYQVDVKQPTAEASNTNAETVASQESGNPSPYKVITRKELQEAVQSGHASQGASTQPTQEELYKSLSTTIDSRDFAEPKATSQKGTQPSDTMAAVAGPVENITKTQVRNQPYAVPKMAKAKVHKKAIAKKQTHAWTIQVASFTDQKHAYSLRAQLKQKGFHAYVNRADTTKGKRIRVYVGPELSLYNAQIQLAKLDKELNTKGLIVRYDATKL